MKMKTMFTRAATIALLALTFIAPARKASATTVTGTFTLVSSTGPVLLVHPGAKFTASVSGSFVSTATLMKSLDGVNFQVDASNTLLNGTGQSKTLVAYSPTNQNVYYRLDITAYTSGSIVTSLADFNNLVRSEFNTFGASVRDTYDNGVDIPSGSQIGVNNTVPFGQPIGLKSQTSVQWSGIQAFVGGLGWNSTLNKIEYSTGTGLGQWSAY